jgi:hypothetical protein
VRPLSLLVFALCVAGCGAATEGANVPASSGVESVPVETDTEPLDESKLRPPAVLLVSAGGEQEALAGSSCVGYVDPVSGEGVQVCGDTGPIHPDDMTVARPGDEVAIVLEGAQVVRPEGCHSDDEQSCIGEVDVRPLGCVDRHVADIPLTLGEKTEWTIDLEPGAYELNVFAYFEARDGRSGDVSGLLGLLVAPDAPPRTVPVDVDLAVCPFPG